MGRGDISQGIYPVDKRREQKPFFDDLFFSNEYDTRSAILTLNTQAVHTRSAQKIADEIVSIFKEGNKGKMMKIVNFFKSKKIDREIRCNLAFYIDASNLSGEMKKALVYMVKGV